MNVVDGDVIQLALDGEFDVIVHGCNCFCAMGKGLAKGIRATFPEAYEADCATEKGDETKLGAYSAVTVERNGHQITIVNAYTQFRYGGRRKNVDYDAMRQVFAQIKTDFAGQRIGYPMIGAGLAGGDWSVIEGIIEEALAGEDHTLVRYRP